MTLAEFKATMRLARRSARRQWKRTILVAVLIAIPVAVAIVGATMSRAGKLTPEEAATADFGSADIRIEMFAAPPELEASIGDLIRTIDPAAVVERQRTVYGLIAAGLSGPITDLDPTGPLASSQWSLVDGSSAVNPREIVLSNQIADRLGVRAGDTVDLRLAGTPPVTYTVAGVVRHRIHFNAAEAFLTSDGLDLLREQRDQPRTTWLIDATDPDRLIDAVRSAAPAIVEGFYPPPPVPVRPAGLEAVPDEIYYALTAEDVETLAAMDASSFEIEMAAYEMVVPASGIPPVVLPWVAAESRSERVAQFFDTEGTFERPEILGTLVATLLLAEVALVAGAAYATGTRRRLREIGLLGSNGATPEHVRAMVLGEGFIGGLLGAVAGLAVAIGAIALGLPLMQRFVNRVIDGFPLQPIDVVGPLVAGVAAATVAAWIPSRMASRVPTVTALQGRMPVKPPSRWVPIAGLVVSTLGAFLVIVAKAATTAGDAGAAQAAVGVILMVTGATLLTGPIVAFVGRFAHRLPTTLRLVARDSARQRTRASAAISALLVVMIGPVLIGIGLESSDASSRIHGLPYPNDHVAVIGDHYMADSLGNVTDDDIALVRSILPDARMATYSTIRADVQFEAEMATLGSPPPGTVDVEFYESADGAIYVEPGRAAIANDDLLELLTDPRIGEALSAGEPVVLGVEERKTRVRIDGTVRDAMEIPVAVTWGTSRLLLTDDMAEAWGLDAAGTRALFVLADPITPELSQQLFETSLVVAVGDAALIGTRNLLLVALGVTLLLVLGIVAMVTALTATESDPDLRTIVAVGAEPSLRRRFLAVGSVYYTLIAAALAAPLGWLLMKAAAPTGQWVEVGPFGSVPSGLVEIPWLAIGGIGVVIPIIAGLAVATLSRSLSSALPRRLT